MNEGQLDKLKDFARQRDYGVGPDHPKQVKRLSLKIYGRLGKVGLLENLENDRLVLSAAALLHDTGYPEQPHNRAAFDLLKVEIPAVLGDEPFPPADLSAILYCALWHNGHKFEGDAGFELIDKPRVRILAGIMRVADALDRSWEQRVDSVKLKFDGQVLKFKLESKYDISEEVERAPQKADLLQAAFKLKKIAFKAVPIE
jgi:exopolyphosphatase / guanosine-5'-triphosphate,3'-diphosphate pyrophosphatase